MQTCCECKKALPLPQFSKDKSRTTGHCSRCKRCKNRQKERRRTTNTDAKMKSAMRSRLRGVLAKCKLDKHCSVLGLLGCTMPEFRAHIENRFRGGMTWENHGACWHLDHIRPVASFDFKNVEHQKKCFHYSNLQPLFALENMRKGAKWDDTPTTWRKLDGCNSIFASECNLSE